MGCFLCSIQGFQCSFIDLFEWVCHNLSGLIVISSLMQRPLKTIARISGDVYIPRGVSVPALDKDVLWEFQPRKLGNPIKNLTFFLYLALLNSGYLELKKKKKTVAI